MHRRLMAPHYNVFPMVWLCELRLALIASKEAESCTYEREFSLQHSPLYPDPAIAKITADQLSSFSLASQIDTS